MKVVSILGLAVALALAGCQEGDNQAQARLAKLEGQVAQLQGKVDRLEVQAHPTRQWILWQRLQVIHSKVPLSELPQPRQLGSYDTKEACEDEALKDASEHGAVGGDHYQNDSQFGAFDIANLCFPDDIDLRDKQR